MRTMLATMKKKKSGIPAEALPLFENIVQKHEANARPSLPPECEQEFFAAMETHLTQEQRYGVFALAGGCKGTGADKARKLFAIAHAHLPLAERLALFAEEFDRGGRVLNDDGTITVNFKCAHMYYKPKREKKPFDPPVKMQTYFERCAGGRLYEMEQALNIKLRIKSVDISPLEADPTNAVVYTFEVIT